MKTILSGAVGDTREGKQRTVNLDRYLVDRYHGLFVIADGFGDAFAPERVIRCIRDAVAASPNDATGVLRRALEDADRVVAAEESANRARRGMGATAVAMLVRGTGAEIACVARARAYRVRTDELELLTPDDWSHPPLEPDGLPPQYVCVGSGRVRVTELRLVLEEGDRFLLCSEGLHRSHEASKILACIRAGDAASPTGRADLHLLVSRLTELDPAPDDRTVVVVAAPDPRTFRAFPERLLEDVQWTFGRPGTDDVPADATRAQIEAAASGDTIVVASRVVHVVFMPWDPAQNDRVDTLVTLRAPSDRGFTALDLLEAIERAVNASLRDSGTRLGDRCFLEGVELAGVERGVPIYSLNLGS